MKKREASEAPRLVVMIPAYNEASTISDVITTIPRQIPGIRDVRVLVIDDGSKDNTTEVAEKAGADFIHKNGRNLGLGITFKTGIEQALKHGADIIVNIDGDGQFDSKDVARLIRPICDGVADMVSCSRFLKQSKAINMPYARKWGNRRFTKLISRLTGKRYTDTQCGFRAYSREAGLRLNLNGHFTYTQEVFLDLASKGMKIIEIPCTVTYPEGRQSKISGNLSRYGFRTLGIVARATRDRQPLTFFGVPALIIFGLGFIGGTFSFIFWLLFRVTTPVRMLFNVSVFLMIFGLALVVFGLLADMLLTIKHNQENILYKLRKVEFDDDIK